MKQQTRRNLNIIGISLVIGAICGMMFSYAMNRIFITGLVIGSFISAVSSTMEVFVFRSRRIKKLRLTVFFLINLAYYIAVIMIPIILVYVFGMGITLAELLRSNIYWYGVTFGILVTIVILFMRNVSSLIGPGVLIKFIAGRYFHPVEERRVFMFLDLNSSTAIAERIGHLRFHSLLTDFFFDISASVLRYRGEVYKYVGDEIIVTWNVERGTRDAACLRCVFDMHDAIEQLRDSYFDRFGVVPAFKAGIHVGAVTVGEMGLLKREIAYLGDTVNTTARIIGEAGARQELLMVSRDLLDCIALPAGMAATGTGSIMLRGKEHAMELYSIRRTGMPG